MVCVVSLCSLIHSVIYYLLVWSHHSKRMDFALNFEKPHQHRLYFENCTVFWLQYKYIYGFYRFSLCWLLIHDTEIAYHKSLSQTNKHRKRNIGVTSNLSNIENWFSRGGCRSILFQCNKCVHLCVCVLVFMFG